MLELHKMEALKGSISTRKGLRREKDNFELQQVAGILLHRGFTIKIFEPATLFYSQGA
jgi:hypothetical protein